MGAKIIEKHFTIDKKMKGPDHEASLEPKELYEMVRLIGERTKQLTMLAKPLVKNIDDLTYEEIAILELRKNVIPFKIKRPLPNNTLEVWDIEELYKDHLEF